MYQKLQCTNTSSWKKFCLFLVIFFVQFVNGYAQDYVNITLADPTSGFGNPTTSGASAEFVINGSAGLSGVGIGWGANLYSASDVGSSTKNIIYDLTWVSNKNNTSETIFEFKDIEVWMYHFNSDAFPNNNRPNVQSGSFLGATNITKVASGKTLLVKTPASGDCIYSLKLDTPFEYIPGNNLVIYIQKTTPYTPPPPPYLGAPTPPVPVFFHNIEPNNKKRRVCNWEDGTVSNPLPSVHKSTSSQKNFARVMFNVAHTNTNPLKGSRGSFWIGSNSPNDDDYTPMAGCFTTCITPVISNKTTSTCSNIALNFTPTATGTDVIPSGTSYKWTFTDNPKVTGEANETTGKTSITSTLINTTDTPQDVEYTVTPSSGTCVGTQFKLTVTVNPAPKISNISKSICSGATFDTVPPSASPNIIPTGTTYKWTFTDNPNVTGEANETTGKTSITSTSNLINTSNTPQDVVYTVTPSSGTCTGTPFTLTITIKPKPSTPTLGTPVDPTCALDGSVLISGLPVVTLPKKWTLKSTAKYNFSTTGNTATYNYTALKPNSKIKFIVELDGCLSDSTAELTVANAPGKPYLEGPSSVCLNSEITLKAWTDNISTPKIKSTPDGTTPWSLKVPGDVDTVSLTVGTNPLETSNIIKGLKALSTTKAGEATIVYKDINGCTSEQTIKVNPLPIAPVLSHLPANPLVFTGNKADSVCKGSDIEFTLTGGTIGDNVYFKDTVLTGTITAKPYLIQATNTFKKKNVLSDINILIDSVSNGICRVNAQPIFKITMVDTAFSLKAFPTTNCGTSTGKIEATTNSTGKLSWANSDLSVSGNQVVTVLPTLPITIPNLKAGTYTVKFINAGCELSETVTISDPNKPYLEPSINLSQLAICAGDSLVIKAWTDKTKSTKSTPKTPLALAWVSNNTNATLKDTINATLNFTAIKVIANAGPSAIITYTDANGCIADTILNINSAGIPTTINNATDLVQSFCAADINKVSNLKPAGLHWFDEKGTVELAPTTVLKTQFYFAAIKDANGCFTKKSDRIKVEVKINANPNDPAVSTTQPFCKVDDPEVADLLPAPSNDIKWFLKSGSNLTPQVPLDKLIKDKYLVKKMKDGCLSINGVEVDVDVISVPKPKAPNQKLCANNEKPLTLGGLYSADITNYYFYDVLNVSLFPSQPVLDGEQYKVKQSLNGCLSEDTTITIKILDGFSFPVTGPIVLTPAFCKVDGPTLAAIEAKYSALPTSGSIYWYDAQNSTLTNDLSKTSDLGGAAYSLWIAVKDADGCFSKKQQVDFTIDPGKRPDLKPIELCKTTDYTLTNLDVANISNPKGTLTWYLSQTGVGLAPTTVPKNSTQEYWASYKETTASCEGERVKLAISSWLDLSQTFTLNETNQKFCKTANKTVDDLNPAPFTDANIAWFETTTTTTPYIDADPLTEKIYYAAEYKITSVGDYCVNPNRVPVNVSLYSNKIYPIVKESVCSKQNGSIEFINPPAGVTFEWYEQADPTTLDFTGAKYNKPLEKQSFKIKIKDVSGCEEEVSVALPECTDSPIPQILSPNNDQFNNKWVINYSGKYKNVQVRIFNRWGNEVYTSPIPYKDDWDGKRNNEYLPSGTYYYVIDKGNGDPIESGYIELIK